MGWLYEPSKMNKHYYYHVGWNIQAYIAYVAGIALPFPGFVGTLGPPVSEPAMHLGQIGWLLSFSTSFVVYYALCLVWPTRNQRLVRESGARWEEAANEEFVAADGVHVTETGLGHRHEDSESRNSDGLREKSVYP